MNSSSSKIFLLLLHIYLNSIREVRILVTTHDLEIGAGYSFSTRASNSPLSSFFSQQLLVACNGVGPTTISLFGNRKL